MAGIYHDMMSAADDNLKRQLELAQGPAQTAGVIARGALDHIGAVAATPMVAVSNAAGDAWEGLKNFGAGFTGLGAVPPTPPVSSSQPQERASESFVSAMSVPTGTNLTPSTNPFHTPESLSALGKAGASRPLIIQQAPAQQQQLMPGQVPGITAPKLAPVNPDFLAMQQDLMNQFMDAQAIVAAGTTRQGYQKGDITRALDTMAALSPVINSANNLIGNSQQTAAGMFNQGLVSNTQTATTSANNATELVKVGLQLQREQAAAAQKGLMDMALAEMKENAEKNSPAGRKATSEAALNEFKLRALQGKNLTDIDNFRALSTNPAAMKVFYDQEGRPDVATYGRQVFPYQVVADEASKVHGAGVTKVDDKKRK